MSKNYVEKVLNVANSYLGYMEKESNSQLESKTKNVGDENYTIFAEKYKKLTGVNLQKNAWCLMFISVIFSEAYGIEEGKGLLNGYEAYTPSAVNNFKPKDSALLAILKWAI